MTRELTRFTTNFAGLLSAQPQSVLRYQPTLASTLGQNAVRLGTHRATVLQNDSLAVPSRFAAPFLQLADALNQPSFPIQLPIGRTVAIDTRDSMGGLSKWNTLATALINRASENFKDIHNALTAIIHALTKPVVRETAQPIILSDSRRLVPLPMIRDRLGSQPQALLPSLPLPRAGLFSQHITTENLTRHQSEIRAWAQPLVAVSAKLAQPTTTVQPHFLMPTLEPRSQTIALGKDLAAQPSAVSQSLLITSISEIKSPPLPVPAMLFNPSSAGASPFNAIGTVATKSSPLAIPFQPNLEPDLSLNAMGTVLAQTPQDSIVSAQALTPPPSPQAVEQSDATSTINFNGGIHVQVSAQTIDQAHAEETARAIAEQVMREVNRINERNRFRRGL